jgi:hypothetical protein
VPDNLLNAFPPDDPLVNVARAALAVVLCFCFPLLLMPCRDSVIRLLDMLSPSSSFLLLPSPSSSSSVHTPLLPPHEQAAEEGQGRRPRPASPSASSEAYGAVGRTNGKGGSSSSSGGGSSSGGSSGGGGGLSSAAAAVAAAAEGRPLGSMSISVGATSSGSPPRIPRPHPASVRGSGASASSCMQRLLLTYLLVLIIVALAVLVDSVALIWAVIGSFGCITVGFIFPPLAYLKVGCRQQRLKRLWAWVILCCGAVLLVLCVAQTVFALAT